MAKSQGVFYLSPEAAVSEPLEEESPLVTENVGCCDSLRRSMSQLTSLIANVTEAYTAAIYLANPKEKLLYLAGVHTLSRDFMYDAKIAFGRGLLGWTAENAVRISVCPFEHDSTTLLYYSKDQDLKSFIAVPVLDSKKQLRGVISCDSKKNYAFAKITEKILLDCAAQAANILSLHEQLNEHRLIPAKPEKSGLETFIEKLRNYEDERELLNSVVELPTEVVKRDALVAMTTADSGFGQGAFYSSSAEERIGHRLLELVCRHKKIICGERSVHALPIDDIKQRSFLSIPFHVMGREAGSLNLLSRPHDAFSAGEISSLEKIAKVVGRELERLRLRDRLRQPAELTGMLSWKQFALFADERLKENSPRRSTLRLLRLSFLNLAAVEELTNIEVASAALARALRLIDQTVRPPSASCCVYGLQILILAEAGEADRITMRIRRLLERIQIADITPQLSLPGARLGELLKAGLRIASADYPRDGVTINELAQRTREIVHTSLEKQALEKQASIKEVANAGNW